MSNCPREGRAFPRCKFEPVYDLKPPSSLPALDTSATGAKIFIDALTEKTFKGTFCIRCGKKGEL